MLSRNAVSEKNEEAFRPHLWCGIWCIAGTGPHGTSQHPTQTVALDGYLFDATLSRSWPARNIVANDGAMLILQASPSEFYVMGSCLPISITRDPDVDRNVAGIESVEQVSRARGQWVTERRLNGDQTNQGQQLLLHAHRPLIYRLPVLHRAFP